MRSRDFPSNAQITNPAGWLLRVGSSFPAVRADPSDRGRSRRLELAGEGPRALRTALRGRLRLEDQPPPGVIDNDFEVAEGLDANMPGHSIPRRRTLLKEVRFRPLDAQPSQLQRFQPATSRARAPAHAGAAAAAPLARWRRQTLLLGEVPRQAEAAVAPGIEFELPRNDLPARSLQRRAENRCVPAKPQVEDFAIAGVIEARGLAQRHLLRPRINFDDKPPEKTGAKDSGASPARFVHREGGHTARRPTHRAEVQTRSFINSCGRFASDTNDGDLACAPQLQPLRQSRLEHGCPVTG